MHEKESSIYSLKVALYREEVLLGAGRSYWVRGGLTGRREVLLGAGRSYWAQGGLTRLRGRGTHGNGTWEREDGPGNKECRWLRHDTPVTAAAWH